MKNLKRKIKEWFDQLDGEWRKLHIGKQRRYILLFFLGYALVSILVLFKICYDMGADEHQAQIKHIENPLIKRTKPEPLAQDSITAIKKNRAYER